MLPSAKLVVSAGGASAARTGTGLIPAVGVIAVGGYAVYKILDAVFGDDCEVVERALPSDYDDPPMVTDTRDTRHAAVESRGMSRVILRR